MEVMVIALALEAFYNLWVLLELSNEFDSHIEKDFITKGWRCFEDGE